MATHKSLQGVVGNVVGSFTSQLNHVDGDYVLGHVVRAAWESGGTELRVDLLSGAIEPTPLAVPAVRAAVAHYVFIFPGLVASSGSDMAFVAAVEMVITVDPSERVDLFRRSGQKSPYRCAVCVTDNRGKLYAFEERGWWSPEEPVRQTRSRAWWRLW